MLAVVSSGDTATGLVIGGVGLLVTLGATTGIIALAARLTKQRSGALVALSILGMLACAGFVLGGLAATGCGAILVLK